MMTRIFTALAAMTATAAPLMTVGSTTSAPPPVEQAAPVMIGLDHPILLKRMVVTATALPDNQR